MSAAAAPSPSLAQVPNLSPTAPAHPLFLRAVAESLKREKAYNTDLCEELDVFCASRGRGVEVATFAKFPLNHRLEALREWCGSGDAAFLELCDRLNLIGESYTNAVAGATAPTPHTQPHAHAPPQLPQASVGVPVTAAGRGSAGASPGAGAGNGLSPLQVRDASEEPVYLGTVTASLKELSQQLRTLIQVRL